MIRPAINHVAETLKKGSLNKKIAYQRKIIKANDLVSQLESFIATSIFEKDKILGLRTHRSHELLLTKPYYYRTSNFSVYEVSRSLEKCEEILSFAVPDLLKDWHSLVIDGDVYAVSATNLHIFKSSISTD